MSAGVVKIASIPHFEALDFINNMTIAYDMPSIARFGFFLNLYTVRLIKLCIISILLCLQFYMIWFYVSFDPTECVFK